MLMHTVKIDYQIYIMVLTSFAAKQGLIDIVQKSLQLDLKVKLLQNELGRHFLSRAITDVDLTRSSPFQNQKPGRHLLLTYLKALQNFLGQWMDTSAELVAKAASAKYTILEEEDDDKVLEVSTLCLQIWALVNHSVFLLHDQAKEDPLNLLIK